MNTILNIEIGRLVIQGLELTSLQQRQLKASLESSLSDLFTEQGIPPGMNSLSSSARLPVAPIAINKQELQPVQLGKDIAASVYQGLNKQV